MACSWHGVAGTAFASRVKNGAGASPRPGQLTLLCMLRLVVQREPRIIVVRREHVAGLDAAGEVVMAAQVQFVVNRDEPGAAAGAARHVAGYGDHQAARVLPAFAGGTRA